MWRGPRYHVPIHARLHTFSRPTVTTARRRPVDLTEPAGPSSPLNYPSNSHLLTQLPSFLKFTGPSDLACWLHIYIPFSLQKNVELRVSRWINCLLKENTLTGKIDQSSSLGLLSLTLPRTIHDIASFVLTSNVPPHVGAVKILWVQSFLSFQNLLALGQENSFVGVMIKSEEDLGGGGCSFLRAYIYIYFTL